MDLRGIDLNLLPVFEAIYVARSIARASETLHITPPAVSNALARLRVHFGDPLFVREGRGIKPTSATEALIPIVRDALDRLRSGLELRSGFDPSKSSRVFNVSVRDAGAFLVAAVLAGTLEREASGVRLHFSQVERTTIPRELASGRLDLAIDSVALHGDDLEHEVIRRDSYVCVLRKGHPCARGKLTLERYLCLRHITVSSRRAGKGSVEESVRRLGHRLTPVMRLPHYMPAFEVVRATDSVLAAPRAIASRQGLSLRLLPFAVPELTIAQYWHQPTSDDPGLRWLRAAMRAAAADGGR
jgi:DNA-binding transcriptional LysR family regulator